MKNSAFKQGISSLFVLTSPLQVLCAIEAIAKFKINDYKIILVFPEVERRIDQVINVCKKNDLKYEVVSENKIRGFSKLIYFFSFGKYKRVFIGDIRNVAQMIVALKYITRSASVVFLDDGTDSIFLFRDGFRSLPTIRNYIYYYLFTIVCFFRQSSYGKYFYTIYDDIENVFFKKIGNKFEYISTKLSVNKEENVIYFIGTNHERFCNSDNFPLEMVMCGLSKVLKNIKTDYPNCRIVYIPHGRDVATFPEQICSDLDIEIKRPQCTIELMLIEEHAVPVAVYGFTSTALYNIKLLFPSVNVNNVIFQTKHTNKFINQIRIVSDYYREHGINEIVM